MVGVRAGRWRDTRTNMWKRPDVGRVGGEPATDHLELGALNLCCRAAHGTRGNGCREARVAAGQRIVSIQRQPTVDIAVTTVV